MSAYVIVEIAINDPIEYEAYKKLTPATVATHGGRFVVRGGKTETLEVNWHPERIVVLEFPTVEQTQQWWASPEYAQAKEIRQRVA